MLERTALEDVALDVVGEEAKFRIRLGTKLQDRHLLAEAEPIDQGFAQPVCQPQRKQRQDGVEVEWDRNLTAIDHAKDVVEIGRQIVNRLRWSYTRWLLVWTMYVP